MVSILVILIFVQSAIRGFNGDYLFNSRISSRYVFVFRRIMTRVDLNTLVSQIDCEVMIPESHISFI